MQFRDDFWGVKLTSDKKKYTYFLCSTCINDNSECHSPVKFSPQGGINQNQDSDMLDQDLYA